MNKEQIEVWYRERKQKQWEARIASLPRDLIVIGVVLGLCYLASVIWN